MRLEQTKETYQKRLMRLKVTKENLRTLVQTKDTLWTERDYQILNRLEDTKETARD